MALTNGKGYNHGIVKRLWLELQSQIFTVTMA